jgi:hypothetical protein
MEYKINYKNAFEPHINSFKKITLNEDKRKKLATKIANLIKNDEIKKNRKLNETEIDRYKKLFMQLVGDLVVEQFLDLDFFNFDDVLNQKKPQINKLLVNKQIDICTFTYGLFPLIYQLTYRKTIFICMLPNKKDYFICGIGTPSIISGFSDKNLLLSSRLKEANRSAFFGFSRLTPLPSNINDFVRIIS